MLTDLLIFKDKFRENNIINKIIRHIMWKLKYEKIVKDSMSIELKEKLTQFIEFISETDYVGISYKNTDYYKSITFTNYLYKISYKMSRNSAIIDYTYMNDNLTRTINLSNTMSIQDKAILIPIKEIIDSNIYDICKNYILEN